MITGRLVSRAGCVTGTTGDRIGRSSEQELPAAVST